jgi:hypothetical protein
LLLSEWGGKIEKKEISFHGIFKWGVEQKYMEFLFFSPQKNCKEFHSFFSKGWRGCAREINCSCVSKHDSEEGRTTEIESAIY